LYTIALDCPDPRALADFYSEMLGLPIARIDDDWIEIGDADTGRISFQLAPDHVPPTWPDPTIPQQVHLDILVEDIDEAEPAVLALGAKRLPSDHEGEGFRVYADPAGHTFCLVWD
jgi:catechol 2,3-dioxygenase-like lactoylglutathione lyase family enzyme